MEEAAPGCWSTLRPHQHSRHPTDQEKLAREGVWPGLLRGPQRLHPVLFAFNYFFLVWMNRMAFDTFSTTSGRTAGSPRAIPPRETNLQITGTNWSTQKVDKPEPDK